MGKQWENQGGQNRHSAQGPGKSHNSGQGPRLYVGNLPYGLMPDELVGAFRAQGIEVTRPHIVSDRETGQSKGFGFVQLGSVAEAENAVAVMNGTSLGGRTIRVDLAHEKER